MLTGSQRKCVKDLFILSKLAAASLLVSFRIPATQEVIQPCQPSQKPGVEHGAHGQIFLVGNTISMHVTEQQADTGISVCSIGQLSLVCDGS